jgi:hypothetical protein
LRPNNEQQNTVTTGGIMKLLQSIFLSFWFAGLTTFAFPLVTTLGRRKPLTEHHDLNDDRVVVLETEEMKEIKNIYKELKREIKESSEKLSKEIKDGMKELREDKKEPSKEIKSMNDNLSKEIKSVNETLVKIFVFLAVLSTLGGMASCKDTITGLCK